MLVRSGITLIKYWFSITDEEQHFRFQMRIQDPLKQWKLSPMDLQSRVRWENYTRAKEEMLERTNIPEARWWVVEAVDKKKARLNCIHHLPEPDPLRGRRALARGAAGAHASRRLSAPPPCRARCTCPANTEGGEPRRRVHAGSMPSA